MAGRSCREPVEEPRIVGMPAHPLTATRPAATVCQPRSIAGTWAPVPAPPVTLAVAPACSGL